MMSSVINKRLALCGLLLALCGCTYGPTPYNGGYGGYGASPYGATYPGGGGYPGGGYPYQAPTQTLQPGQQYVPGGTVTPQGVYPGGTPTYQENNQLVPIPNNGANSNAPPYSSTEIGNPVPAPSNSNGSPFYNNSNSKSTFQPPIDSREIQPAAHLHEPLQPMTTQLRETQTTRVSPGPTATYSPPAMESFGSPDPMDQAIDINKSEIPTIPAVDSGHDPFSTPIPAPGQNNAAPAMPIFDNISNIRSNKPVLDPSNPFGYDERHRWVRGVVSRDVPTGTWFVVYSDNPDESDPYAGHLSLASSPYLKGLKDGDVVHLEGEVDPVLKDALGKPVYLVSHLKTVSAAPVQE